MAPPYFNARKAAQVAAFFVEREGGLLAVLKLVKLMYLADREHLQKFGYPILNDHLVSMPHGPVVSWSYNLIGGNDQSADWDELITDRDNYNVGLRNSDRKIELDELSDAEIESIQTVWKQFSGMDKWLIRDWTHDNCPEWEDPHGGSHTIPYERVLKYLGHANAAELSAAIDAERSIERSLASLR